MKRLIPLLAIALFVGHQSFAQFADDCASAGPLNANQLNCAASGVSLTGSTVGATTTDGVNIAGCIDGTANNGVWFTFTAQGADLEILSNAGADLPYFTLFTGACGGLTPELCGQLPLLQDLGDVGDDLLTIGTTYYVWIGYDGIDDVLDICVTNPPAPANDDCTSPEAVTLGTCVTGGSAPIMGSTEHASPDGLDFSCLAAGTNGEAGVWYSFTAQGSDLVVDDVSGNAPFVVVVDGCTGGSLLLICEQAPFDLTSDADNALTPGDNYLMWVGFDGQVEEEFSLCIDNPMPPVNDDCNAAIDINTNGALICSETGVTLSEDLYGADGDFNFPCLPGSIDFEGVWYEFDLQGHEFYIQSSGTIQPYIVLTSGCDPGTDVVYFCGQTDIDPGTINDITGRETNNSFTPEQVDAGLPLYMWVGSPVGEDADFTICVDNPEPPENDLCNNAIELMPDEIDCSNSGVTIIGTIEHGTNYLTAPNFILPPFGEPGCFDNSLDEVVWYRFTAQGVDISLEVVSGDFDLSFAILENWDCNAPNPDNVVACGTMPYDFDIDPDDLLEVGREYYLMLGYQGGWMRSDSFEVCIDNPEPPENDLCRNAIIIGPNQLQGCPGGATVSGTTVNSSQQDLFFTNMPALIDLPCAIDTLEDDGVWYSFTAIGTNLAIDDIEGNNPTVLVMNNNGCADTFSSVYCGPLPLSDDIGDDGFLVTNPGDEYLVYVTFQGGEVNNDIFEICIDNSGNCANSAEPPANWCDATQANGFQFCSLFDLDGFCFRNGNSTPYDVHEFPGCPNTVHNPNWFTFYAGADNLQLEVFVGGCSGQGVQLAMYELDCQFDVGSGQPCPMPALAGSEIFCSTQDPINGSVIIDQGLEPGQFYGIIVDGWAGDICNVQIQVRVGGEPPSFDDVLLDDPVFDESAFPYEGDTICAGAEEVPFAINSVEGACRYDWTINGADIPDSDNDTVELIDFLTQGNYQICVTAGNTCASTAPVCVDITVLPLDPELTRDTICEGDSYEWFGPFGEMLDIPLDLTTQEGGRPYNFRQPTMNLFGCEVDALLELYILDENNQSPTEIDTVLCSSDIPFVYLGSEPLDPEPFRNNILEATVSVPIANDGRCDSFFRLNVVEVQLATLPAFPQDQYLLDAPEVTCMDSVIEICPEIPPTVLPDPSTPGMNVEYIWVNLVTGDTVSNGECLTIRSDQFVPNATNTRVEQYIILDYNGLPRDKCIHGPFRLNLDLREFMPDSVAITGPDTVCVGPEYTYSIMVQNPQIDEFRDADNYIWDLSEMPGATRTEINEDSSLITFSQVGLGRICVTAEHFCINSATVCKEILVAPEPDVDAGDDVEECSDVHQLSASPAVGFWTVINTPPGSGPVTFSDTTDPNASVEVIGKGVYTFRWNVPWFGCNIDNDINVDFVQAIDLVGDIQYTCGAVSETFTASFSFTGGIAPFTLTQGSGTLDNTAMTFESDPILVDETMVVVITDADGCTAQFILDHDCDCLTEGGVMAVNDPRTLCGESSCIDAVPLMDPVPDGNDIVVYVLHTNANDTLGTVIEENQTGTFCLTPGGAIQFDVQYYVSVVVGNEAGGTVDLTDRCAQIAPGQPVIWREQPAPGHVDMLATCASSQQLSVTNNNFGGEWIVISAGTNITFDDQTSPNATISTAGCGVVELGWVETNDVCVDTALTTVEFYCNPTAGSPRPGCNADFSELSFTIALSGVGPFTETTGAGSFNGNEYVVDGLPAPYPGGDVLTFVDANGCTIDVPLPIADCNCIPIVDPDTACGLTITLTSDGTGNSGFWTEGTHQTGTGTVTISSPNTRTTDISVSDFGIYCFDWTEEGSLCTLNTQVCIPFVDAPVVDESSVMFSCDDIYENYTVSFDIQDGHQPSYTVTDELGNNVGSIIGSTFTSVSFPSLRNVTFLISDGFMCDTFQLDTVFDCGCFTEVGDLAMDPLYLCLDESTSVDYDVTNEMRDGNDILGYILYTDAADPFGSIIAQSVDGSFAYDASLITIGTEYYVAAVLADGVGGVIDLTDDCRSISMAMPVVWYDATVPTITSSLPQFTCTDTVMTLTVAADGLPDDYNVEWTTTNGAIRAGDETSISPTITRAGSYTVTVRHNLAGCESTAMILVGESDDIPDINLTADDILTCADLEVVVSGQGSATGASITYLWSGPGIVGPNDGIDITVDQPGTYTLRLTDTANGCVISASVVVGQDIANPAAAASVDQLFDCNTDQVTLSGQGSSEGSNITYSWTALDGGNIVGSSNLRDAIVDVSGTYQIEVFNSDNGCTSTATVTAMDDPAVITDINLSVLQVTCDGNGSDGQIVVSQVIGGTPPYMYSFDGGLTYQDENSLLDIPAGLYPISVLDDNGCDLRDTVVLIQPEDFSLELGETIVVEFGDSAVVTALTDLPAEQIQSILWSPLYDSSATSNSLTQAWLPDLGQYGVNLTMTSINGCTNEDFVLVVVKFGERIYIPNAMRPGSGNPDNQVINIYADPTSVSEIPYFAIYDRWGERVFERTDIPPSLDLQSEYAWDGTWRDELAHGGAYVYYVEVEFVTGVTRTIKGSFTLLR